jgi:multicomponent Na+:H+ antiporter subunit D
MMLLSGLSIGIGITPAALYAFLPHPMDGTPYAAGHLAAQLQIVMFAGLAFALLLRWRWDWLRPTQTIMLDTDWFYRKLGPALTRKLDRWASRLH